MENMRTKRFGQTKAAAPILLLAACTVWIMSGGSRGSWRYDFQNQIFAGAEEMYMPGLAYLNRRRLGKEFRNGSKKKLLHGFLLSLIQKITQ